MFKCQKCPNSGYRPNRVVIERKMHRHIPEDRAHGPCGGYGSQIVKEIVVCDDCLPTVTTAEKPERVIFEKAPVKKVDFTNADEDCGYAD